MLPAVGNGVGALYEGWERINDRLVQRLPNLSPDGLQVGREQGQTALREAIETVGGKIIGIVINRLDRRGSGYYYYQYQYNYRYKYGPFVDGAEGEEVKVVGSNGAARRSGFLRRKPKQRV